MLGGPHRCAATQAIFLPRVRGVIIGAWSEQWSPSLYIDSFVPQPGSAQTRPFAVRRLEVCPEPPAASAVPSLMTGATPVRSGLFPL